MKKLALMTMVIAFVVSTASFADLTYRRWDVATGNIDEAWAIVDGETAPDVVQIIGASGVGDQGIDNFVASITGYLIAPTDGDYVFYCQSDDDSQLLLSTDGDIANAVLVSRTDGWANNQEWTSGNLTPSEPIALTAGQLVAIKTAMREGTGGDSHNIGWLAPGATGVTLIPAGDTLPNDAALAVPRNPSPADGATGVVDAMLSWDAPVVGAEAYDVLFGTDPAALDKVSEGQAETSYDAGSVPTELAFSTTYYWGVMAAGETSVWSFTTADPVVINSVTGDAQPLGAVATLAVDAVSPVGAELTYAWHRLNLELMPGMIIPDAPIPGAESATLVIDPVTAGDQGEYYCMVTSPDGAVASPVVFMDAQTGLIHEWTFNDSPDGVTIPDVVGGADGVLVNQTGNAVIADGQCTTGNDGSQISNQTTGDYVDLPNGLVSPLTQMTIECWATWTDDTAGLWQRVYDFGTSNGGEDISNNADAGGAVYDFYSTANNNASNCIIEYRHGGTSPIITPLTGGPMPLGEEIMIGQTHDDKANVIKMYINGVAVGGYAPLYPLKAMTDNNNWLGRSQWGDELFVGSWNEFRIYDTVLSADQIAADYLAGPDAMGVLPEPCGTNIVGDLNGDCVYDFLDAAIAADTFLTDLIEEQAAE